MHLYLNITHTGQGKVKKELHELSILDIAFNLFLRLIIITESPKGQDNISSGIIKNTVTREVFCSTKLQYE